MVHNKIWRFYAPVGKEKETKLVSIVFNNKTKARREQTLLEKMFKEVTIKYYEKPDTNN